MESHASQSLTFEEPSQTLMWKQQSEYCTELLLQDGTELSFEELRAKQLFQCKELVLNEKLQQLQKAKERLSLELEEKKRLLNQQQSQPRSAQKLDVHCEGFQIYDESETQPPTSRNQLQDDDFLRPGETGLAVTVQCPGPGRLITSEPNQKEGVASDQVWSTSVDGLRSAEAGDRGETQKPPPSTSQKLSKSRTNLSPIEEVGDSSSFADHLVEGPTSPVSGYANLNDTTLLRQRLQERFEATSCPNLHFEPGLAPAVEEHCFLQLGDSGYQVLSRLLEHERFFVYGAVLQERRVMIKVDKCSSLWDFHMIQRLKTESTAAEALPEISCYQFRDGCITVYSPQPSHMISVLPECVTSEDSLLKMVPSLLQLLCLLKSCGLVHGDLQPSVLACLSSGTDSNWLFPLEWSLSVDLDLQRDVVSLQQLPAAQTYISRGVLDPSASPHQLDLVGVAQTIHLLLTSNQMVPVKDSDGWTAHNFGEDTSDCFHARWSLLFRTLLSAGSSESDLTEVLEMFTF